MVNFKQKCYCQLVRLNIEILVISIHFYICNDVGYLELEVLFSKSDQMDWL
jgi:hypothetical protein